MTSPVNTTGTTAETTGAASTGEVKTVDINANCTAILYSIDNSLQVIDRMILNLAQLTEQAADQKANMMNAFEQLENCPNTDGYDPAKETNPNSIYYQLEHEFFANVPIHNTIAQIQGGGDNSSGGLSSQFTDENTRVQAASTSLDGTQNIWNSSNNLVTQNRTLGTTLGQDIVQYLASITRFFS